MGYAMGQDEGIWLSLELPLENELAMEKQCRAIRECEDLNGLREISEALIRQNTSQQIALTQFVHRVAELESEFGG